MPHTIAKLNSIQ